ncbi:MAG: hypothetical protein AB7U92_00510 [Piscinibacter sp.]|uniref:hypothetical protein n=1 Tax=Piscinibacter sp. TaxID=1903157 RepID=UPI003D0CE04C
MDMPSMDVTPITAGVAPTVIVAPAQVPSNPRLACRCEGCGAVVTFDSLIVSCRCADDGRPADSAPR